MRTWRLLALAAGLTGVMPGTVFSADTVKVFRYDGSLQCGMGQAVPLDEMAKELTAVHIKVLSSEKSVVSGLIIALCGAPTGRANVYEIAQDDLPRIPADRQGVKRFRPWVYGGPSIEVAKYDGSLQCEMGRPVSLEEMAKELRAANIAVQAKAKKADGIQHLQMCGASTGTMNVYRINTSDCEKARVLGFVLYIEGISIAQRSKDEQRGDATLNSHLDAVRVEAAEVKGAVPAQAVGFAERCGARPTQRVRDRRSVVAKR